MSELERAKEYERRAKDLINTLIIVLLFSVLANIVLLFLIIFN